ncbi:MAG: GNAT family N-acetyltransferase [Chloroflexota bacterium]
MTDAAPRPVDLQIRMGVTIRPAVREDVAKLEMEGLFTKFRNIFRRAYREMNDGQRLLLVADCNETLIGRLFILFNSSDHSIADGKTRAYLYSFFVAHTFRRMGLGTRMVTYAEETLIERGFRHVTIAVAKDNPGALRLYRRLGYRVLREDAGRWSYTDHTGRTHRVNEPCFILEKVLRH